MWWARAEPVDLYLGGGRWRLSGADGLLAAGPVEGDVGDAEPLEGRAPMVSAPDALGLGVAQRLDEVVAAWPARGGRRAPGRLWLGGDLARPFLLPRPPPRSTVRVRDDILQGAARQVFDGATPCRVWVAPGGLGPHPTGHPSGNPSAHPSGHLGVAVPMPVVQAIDTWCVRHRIRLRRIAPWWSQVFDAWSSAAEGPGRLPSPTRLAATDSRAARPLSDGARAGIPAALAVYDAATLTMLATQDGRFTRVRSAAGIATLDDARALWTRAVATLDPAPQRAALLALDLGASAGTSADAIPDASAGVIDGGSGIGTASPVLAPIAAVEPWNFWTERCGR